MQQFYFRRYIIPGILLFLLIFPSCKPQQAAEKKIISQAEMESYHARAVNEFPDYDNITRILNLLKDLDLIYVQEVVNSINNADKYTSNELLMAANIGVYMTDIGYMWTYEVIDDAFNYNIIVFALADQLGMNMEYLETFFDTYSKEDANPDSILVLLERDLGDAVNQFPEGKRLEYYSAMLTGSFIEKLHIIYMLISQCPQISNPGYLVDQNLQRLVWVARGQEKALDDLNKHIEEFGLPEEQMLYHKELSKLDSMMKSSDFLNASVISNPSMIPDDPGFINLFNEVSKLRNLITDPGAPAL